MNLRLCPLRCSIIFLVVVYPAVAARKLKLPENSSQQQLVKFELTALGPHGDPVADLQSSECQVFEDGKRETLGLFDYDGIRRRDVNLSGPALYSNRDSFAIYPTIVLLDLLSERVLTWGQAGQELTNSLLHLESGNGVYVYILTNQGGLLPVHALPPTETEMRSASPDWNKQIRILMDAVTRELGGFRPMEDHVPAWRADLTFQSLSRFALDLATIPGRKNLVWITHGVPRVVPGITEDDMIDLAPQLRQLSETFVQSNISVYPVAQSAAGAGAALGYSWEALQMLAELTGGRLYPSDNIETALAEAQAGTQGSYVVGYYPRRQNADGKYHKLRVTCARKGLRLQTKQGYWAIPNRVSPDSREQAALAGAAGGPFDDPGIGLRASLSVSQAPRLSAHLKIQMDPLELLVAVSPEEDHSAQVSFQIIQYSSDNTPRQPVPLTLTQQQIEQLAKKGIEAEVPLDGSGEKLRIVVYDRRTNRLGSLTVPVPAGPR